MKDERGNSGTPRRQQLFKELVHDSYKAEAKLPDGTHCPECSAVFHKGRWTWGEAGAPASVALCPACHRIRDRLPAGYVGLGGKFFREHREQILQLVRHREAREKAARPLVRIIAIKDTSEGVLVTTTDTHLARDIAEALYSAYKGELDYRYNKEENLLRAAWSR